MLKYTSAKKKCIAELCKGSTADSDSVCLGSNPRSAARKKQIAKAICFFQLYSPTASCMHFVRDIAFGSDMRFARFGGEYNITATAGSNITFA